MQAWKSLGNMNLRDCWGWKGLSKSSKATINLNDSQKPEQPHWCGTYHSLRQPVLSLDQVFAPPRVITKVVLGLHFDAWQYMNSPSLQEWANSIEVGNWTVLFCNCSEKQKSQTSKTITELNFHKELLMNTFNLFQNQYKWLLWVFSVICNILICAAISF